MGNYSYMCRRCGKSIRKGEQAHLIHLRHSEILGEAEGTYNGYGGVEEDLVFDRHGKESVGSPCCHDEIMKSTFHLDDSYKDCLKNEKRLKVLFGRPISLVEFAKSLHLKNPNEYPHEEGTRFEWDWDLQEMCKEAYEALEDAEHSNTYSGVVAYHAVCYHRLEHMGSPIAKEPSESDPNQGWGAPRKEFM